MFGQERQIVDVTTPRQHLQHQGDARAGELIEGRGGQLPAGAEGAVGVGRVQRRVQRDVMDPHVLAVDWVQRPKGRVAQRHAAHLDVRAVVQLHQVRPARADRRTLLPAPAALAARPLPPPGALPVDRAAPADDQMLCVGSAEKARE